MTTIAWSPRCIALSAIALAAACNSIIGAGEATIAAAGDGGRGGGGATGGGGTGGPGGAGGATAGASGATAGVGGGQIDGSAGGLDGTGGVSGTGGAAGQDGSTGQGGSAGTGGIGGLGGQSDAGGAAGTDGSAGTGGIGGLGGQSGTDGAAGTDGSADTGGTTSLTIAQLRDPAVLPNPALGASVTLAAVVVTGVRKLISSSNGFYVSDEVSGPWHCIFVHTGTTLPTVSVGDRIDIAGALGDFNGLDLIANGAVITVVASGAPLPELNTTVADLIGPNGEAYESCRVRLQSVTGVTIGTAVGLEQAGSQIKATQFIWSGSGAFVTSGTTYSQAKGFVNYNLGAHELIPQFDSDLVPP